MNIDTLEALGVQLDSMDFGLHLYTVGGSKWKAEVFDFLHPSATPVWHNEHEATVRELILTVIKFAQQARA